MRGDAGCAGLGFLQQGSSEMGVLEQTLKADGISKGEEIE